MTALQAKPGRPNYMAGSTRSVGRLKNLGFDPIKELVDKYRDLENELTRQKKIRNSEIVELYPSGKPKAFNPELMLAIYDKQVAIAEKLLRYRYGRVPEIEDAPKAPMPMIINLTQKGETYIINDEQPDANFAADEDSDDNDD